MQNIFHDGTNLVCIEGGKRKAYCDNGNNLNSNDAFLDIRLQYGARTLGSDCLMGMLPYLYRQVVISVGLASAMQLLRTIESVSP